MESRSEFLRQVEQHLVHILDSASGVLHSFQDGIQDNSAPIGNNIGPAIDSVTATQNQTAILNSSVETYAQHVNTLCRLLHSAIEQTPLPVQTKSSTALKAFVVENLLESIAVQTEYDPNRQPPSTQNNEIHS